MAIPLTSSVLTSWCKLSWAHAHVGALSCFVYKIMEFVPRMDVLEKEPQRFCEDYNHFLEIYGFPT